MFVARQPLSQEIQGGVAPGIGPTAQLAITPVGNRPHVLTTAAAPTLTEYPAGEHRTRTLETVKHHLKLFRQGSVGPGHRPGPARDPGWAWLGIRAALATGGSPFQLRVARLLRAELGFAG